MGLYILAWMGSMLYAVGLIVQAEDQSALNEGILKGVNEDLSHLNTNARAYAEDFLSIENIMGSFEQFMLHQKKVPIKSRVHAQMANSAIDLKAHVHVELGTKS